LNIIVYHPTQRMPASQNQRRMLKFFESQLGGKFLLLTLLAKRLRN